MNHDTIPVAALVAQRKALEAELAEIDARRERIGIELDVLNRIIHGTNVSRPTAEKLGPAAAVRKVLADASAPLTRKEIIDRAMRIVSTSPQTARKTLDQTIRNLTNRDLKEENGQFVLLGSTNGHQD